MFDEVDDIDSVSMIDDAIRCHGGDKEELQLFQELFSALEVMKDDSFNLDNCEINDGVMFVITTDYPNPLPNKVAELFFNADLKFDIIFQETDILSFAGKRHFIFHFVKNNWRKL